MNKKRTPIGLSDFKKLITEDCYFIDKSLLIKDVVEGSDIILYPRPRRFGKTLNLSMLRYFYDNREENHTLFKGLKIAKEKTIMQKMGKHPVIYLTFKDVKSSSYDHCMEVIFKTIKQVYEEHYYLFDSLTNIQKIDYDKILYQTASIADYESSLKKLCYYLSLYHKANPVILIDEYDMPIQAAFSYGYYEKIVEFIRNLLSGCLKDNTYLEKAVLTGILRVAKESIFSGLNNLKVCSLISKYSADKFGFTQSEVEQCLKDHNQSSELAVVKEWYDGYNFSGNEIYNPWSILNFVEDQQIRPYWVNTSGNELIKTLLQNAGESVKQDLELLISGIAVEKSINDNIVYADVSRNPDSLWNFLLMSGYLRYDDLRLERNTTYAKLSIPNREVLYLYESEIITNWFSESYQKHQLKDILHHLTKGDVQLFRFLFIEFCISSFSYFDVAGDEPEKFYHAFVLGLIVTLRDKYQIKSNRESGYGRYDIMLIPANKNERAFIFEFKKVNLFAKETFETAMIDAKKQIQEKNYAQELIDLGISQIFNVVAVFEKKEVVVEIYTQSEMIFG